MTNMIRTSIAAVYLLLAAVTLFLLVAWPFTRSRPLFIACYGPTGTAVILGVGWGNVYVCYRNVPMGTDVGWSIGVRYPDAASAAIERTDLESLDKKHSLLNFFAGTSSNLLDRPELYRSVASAPVWAFCIPEMILIQWWIRTRWRYRHRRRNRLCVQCGYNLLATPAQCPECGLKVANVG